MPDVRIEGLAKLQMKLRALPERLQAGPLKKSTGDAAEIFRADAALHAPKDTGVLTLSIYLKRVRQKKWREKFQVKVRKRAYYWTFQEFGSSRNAAQPFMRPAFHNNKRKALEEFRRSFAVAIAEAARNV